VARPWAEVQRALGHYASNASAAAHPFAKNAAAAAASGTDLSAAAASLGMPSQPSSARPSSAGGRPRTAAAQAPRRSESGPIAVRPSTSAGNFSGAASTSAAAAAEEAELEQRLQRFVFSRDAAQLANARLGLTDLVQAKVAELMRKQLTATDKAIAAAAAAAGGSGGRQGVY